MPDQTLTCSDCGELFNWTEASQKYFAERGWSPPARCHVCRHRRHDDYDRNQRVRR